MRGRPGLPKGSNTGKTWINDQTSDHPREGAVYSARLTDTALVLSDEQGRTPTQLDRQSLLPVGARTGEGWSSVGAATRRGWALPVSTVRRAATRVAVPRPLGGRSRSRRPVMSGESPVVHFEMPYEDGARVTRFYQQAFGWGMQSTGPQMGDYVTAQSAETDENGMVTSPGTINGGFYPRSAEGPQHPSVVIAVADIGAATRSVTEAGGAVLGRRPRFPGSARTSRSPIPRATESACFSRRAADQRRCRCLAAATR